MKIRPEAAEFFQADGQTHKMKLTLSILNLADAPETEKRKKNLKIYSIIILFSMSFAA